MILFCRGVTPPQRVALNGALVYYRRIRDRVLSIESPAFYHRATAPPVINASFRKFTPVHSKRSLTSTGVMSSPFFVFLRGISISALVISAMSPSTSACCSFLHSADVTVTKIEGYVRVRILKNR